MGSNKTRRQLPIDIVVPWVDPTDPVWQEEKRYWSEKEGVLSTSDDGENRYRDWDTVRYLLRSIDKFAPWVRRVHFITYGHLPEWLDTNAPRLHIVKHSDYLDPRYLPTYSSHTIELSMHKIKGLAEQFIYFNDDIVITRPVKPERFFKNGLPRDYAVLSPAISSHRYSVTDIAVTDTEIINDHFRKNAVIKKNLSKWFAPCYGKDMLRTLCLMPWDRFAGFYGRHLCLSYRKSTFKEVWEKEREVLDSTSMHKFRTRRDVNQWLMRSWQLASGRFEPISPKDGRYYKVGNDNSELLRAIRTQRFSIICANDNSDEKIVDFEARKRELCEAFESIMPEKSSFEK
ncbi:MAG: Stealth CR1 domain-containing protein [Ruminococcus sp.]|nr:Stealth CR1 domain-containing protein [Ruminococcus sp.]